MFPGTWEILEEFLFPRSNQISYWEIDNTCAGGRALQDDAKYEIIQNNLSLSLKHFYMNTSKLTFHLKQK